LIGVELLIAFPASVLGAVLEARQRFDVLGQTSIPVLIASALATVVVLDAGYGIIALVWIAIAAELIEALLLGICAHRLFPELRLGVRSIARNADRSHLRRLRSYSTWTSLNEVLAEGSAELEKLIVPVLLSVALLTPYSLIVTVCAVIFLVVEPITDAFFPLSSAYDAVDDKRRLRELLVRGTKLAVGVSLPLAVAIAFYGRDFILLWIGAENVEIPSGIVPLVVVNFAVTAFVLTGTTILLATGRVKEVFWIGIAELLIALVLVLLSVPATQLLGLAGSLLAANVLVTFGWIVPFLCRYLDQNALTFLGASVARPLLAAVPMALALLLLDRVLPEIGLWRIALSSALAGCVYVVAFAILSLTSQERALILASLRAMLKSEPE
jgi:O-antigen/teichoic acid export membrane protein